MQPFKMRVHIPIFSLHMYQETPDQLHLGPIHPILVTHLRLLEIIYCSYRIMPHLLRYQAVYSLLGASYRASPWPQLLRRFMVFTRRVIDIQP